MGELRDAYTAFDHERERVIRRDLGALPGEDGLENVGQKTYDAGSHWLGIFSARHDFDPDEALAVANDVHLQTTGNLIALATLGFLTPTEVYEALCGAGFMVGLCVGLQLAEGRA